MSEQKKYDILKYNETAFAEAGDYLIPKIELQPIEAKRLGKYGRIRRAFLQKHNPMLFNDLVLTEQLFLHLCEVQEIAEKRVDVIMERLLRRIRKRRKKRMLWLWQGI